MTMPNITPEQQQMLERKIIENDGEYVLPDQTQVVHESGYNTPDQIQKPVVHTAEPQISQTVSVPETEAPSKTLNDIKERIKHYEDKLGRGTHISSDIDQTFLDSAGNPTFYVKNVSGTHVLIDDIPNIEKIKAGTSADLLQSASLEELTNSRVLRKFTRGLGNTPVVLKRLTEMQFEEELRREYEDKVKIDALRRQEAARTQTQQNNINTETLPHERIPQSYVNENKIRPVIEAKLGKLMLRNDPDPQNSRLAMTSVEFIQWIQSEPLSTIEIDHILGNPVVSRDQAIKVALLEKRKNTPPS